MVSNALVLPRTRLLQDAPQPRHHQRRQRHRQGDGEYLQAVLPIGDQVLVVGELEHHEGEFAAAGQQCGEPQRIPRAKPAHDAAQRPQQHTLHQQQAHHQQQHAARLVHQQHDVHRHADADEEQAQQQTLERLQMGFQLVPVFGVGQQHTGQERAQRGGHADHLHQPRGAHHHQQGGGGGYLHVVGLSHETEHRTQQIAAADHHRHDRCNGAQDGIGVEAMLARCAGQQRHGGDERNGGKILKQQDGEGLPAIRRAGFLALRQNLQAERRGRQRQAAADDDGGIRRETEQEIRRTAEHQDRCQHLQQAGAEHLPAHHPQS